MSSDNTQRLEQLRRAVLLRRLQEQGGGQTAIDSESPIPVADRTRPLPLSLAQQRLWFLDQLDKTASTAYHLSTALRLKGNLDVDALQATLDRVVARHENLRTRFSEIEGVPYQQIAPATTGFSLGRGDLTSLSAAEREVAVEAAAAEEARAPFDLGEGPLIRGRLLALADDEHVLLVTQHHIVSDGWSMGVLVREVAALYTAFRRGESDPLPPLEIQYADYAQWQRARLEGEELARQLAFWRDHLRGAPALLELPLDRPRPTVQSHAGGAVPLALSQALTSKLQALSQRHGVTLFMTLLSAWGLLLSRLSGQHDVVIGTAVANRQRREVERLIGFFVNTLALRLRFDEQPTVASLLERVKETTLAAFAHQELPFEQVVEAVRPQRSLSHSPLFQSLFSFNNTPEAGAVDLPELRLMPIESAQESTQFDLSLSLRLRGERIEGAIGYASALFDPDTVARWGGHYERLLEAMVSEAYSPVDALPLLSDAERRQVLFDFNATQSDHPKDTLVHALFERQAAVQPDAVAVVCDDHRLTYRELNERASQLAHELIARGVRPDDRVAISVERGLEMIVGLLGILKAGGAYVPLDPAYPQERLQYMLQNAAPAVVLTQQLLEQDRSAQSTANPDPRALGLTPRNLAYVIYTSGSTGQPKGVAIEHRNTANLLHWALANFDRDALANTLFSTSINFDLAVWELFVPLAAGRTVTLVRNALALTARPEPVTLINTVPSAIKALLEAGGVPSTAVQVNLAGEPLKKEIVERLFTETSVDTVANLYGPSETTTYSTWVRMPREQGFAPHIGRPIDNTRVYILDPRGEPVPVGVTGEIYIGGDGVARGYLGRPELTAERFRRDPFSEEPEARMYRTGDLGRWRRDGNIEYLGRNDFQVKIRGFRIELGEIEARLSRCPGVREAAVVAREDVMGDKRLVAYVVAESGASLNAAELRAALQTQLPEHMLPSAFVQLGALPLTSNGKLDRKALPAPDDAALIAREHEPPAGEIEETIADLWRSLLGVERVGRNDQFFDLGGHSLLAVQLVSRLRSAFHVEVPLRALFAAPSLRGLAGAVRAAGASTMGRIVPADRSRPLPLSLAQQRLWFLDQLDQAASAAYHMPAALRMHGRLNEDVLQATLDRLLARHESLRTRFVAVDGVPYQQIAADVRFALRREDLSALPHAEREEAVAALAATEARAPFDLGHGPLIRGRLLHLSNDEHVLLLTQHHIVSDGWSLGILVRELAALYTAFASGEADPLPPLEVQYGDYAQWQRAWLQGEELERQTEFWKSHLAGAPALLDLPLDRPRPAVQSHAGGTVPLVLPPDLTAGLRAFSQRHGVTLFMTLLSAWGLLLSRLSGQSDIVIGTPVANRQRREIEELIGFFVNTLAIRLRFDEPMTVQALLQRVKETALAALAHGELPFEQVVEAVQPQRSMSSSPLFQSMLAFGNARSRDALPLPDLTLTPVERVATTTHFELSAGLSDQGAVISGVLEYASDLFDRATIERWAGHYVRLLEAMVADASAAIETLPLLSDSQRAQLLWDFNATRDGDVPDALVHELVERQAALQGDAIAVVMDDRSLTYAALNECANQIAHELIARGVRPDDRVAICADRSPEMVAGLLGILKAGGAYVPLDPSYPIERLQFMLRDCAPKALLTQQAIEQRLSGIDVPVLWLDEPSTHPLSNPSPRQRGLTAAHLAYVIYTSGSTGIPKGVAMPQSALQNLLHWQAHDSTPGRFRTVQYSALGFDVAFQETFSTLGTGGTLVLVRDDVRRDPSAFLAFLRESRVERLFLPFVALSALAEAAARDEEGLPPLRHLITAGEQLVMTPAIRALLARTPDCRLHNHYGPTESHVVTALAQTSERNDWPELPPIGRPIANCAIYVLDERREPLPIGVRGEIYIGGTGVARGYLDRPELTAARFLRDPFSANADARMYRTGDVGRWLPDGTLEYLGRNDFQVKIRGFRLELGEIEAKLNACAGVREAVVVAREDAPGDKRLVAYFVTDEGEALQPAELRAMLMPQLPEYMIPAAFVRLEAMPLSPNGKLDRRALPAPDASALSTRAYEAPQGDIERKLAAIWQALLHLDQIGRQDDFFALGGHSLLAVQLMSRIRTTLGVDVALRDLFVQPTLQGLATVVRAAGAIPMSAIERADRSGNLPLSLAQTRLWFLDQLDKKAGAAYHLSAALRLRGALNVAALTAALDRVVARHEALRTTFVVRDGQPCQEIAPADCGFALKLEDLRRRTVDERATIVATRAAEEARAPFDLGRGPLIRGRLVALAADEHVLLLTQHHIVSDGWSLGILVREVATLYAAYGGGGDDPLPPLEIQYADYAQWQRRWLQQGGELERQLDFWKSHLAGAPTLLNLPLDHPRPAVQSHAGGAVPFGLSPSLTAALQSFSQRHGVTPFMTLLAAWSVLLSRLSGQRDVVIGTSVANRQRPEVEALIGFFVNTLALRLRLDGFGDISALLAHVKETTLAAFAHQELPFEQVVEAVQPQRSLSHSPLFQAQLVLDNTPEAGAIALPGLSMEPVERANDTTHFDLSLSMRMRGDRLDGVLSYASALFDRQTIERWAGHFERVLEAMVNGVATNVAALPLLLDVEQTALLQQCTGPVRTAGRERLLPRQIEDQAARTPDAIAVCCGARSVTYAELDARANRLAHYLLEKGAGRGAHVGVRIGRAIELLIAQLAIMKTGAAYVPLDPKQKGERLGGILGDAGIGIVLSEELPKVDAYPVHAPDVALHADDTIYLLYTSGSTGEPKGVEVHHGGVIDYCAFARQNYYGEHLQGSLVATSPAFDLTLPSLYVPLLCGGRVEMLPEEDELEALSAWLADDAEAMLLRLTPSHVQALLALSDGAPRQAAHRFVIGGEALEPALARRLQAKLPNSRIYNHYGPTETVVGCAWFDVTASLDALSTRVPIGRPMENTALYVVDAEGRLQPPGVPGELYIGGAGVAKGYWNRPELTARKFVTFAQSRVYRSGDHVLLRADGNLEFLGRLDRQVKLRGFRIELGEIESRLRQCAVVRDAVVQPYNDQLIAYVVAGGHADEQAVHERLSSQLPSYMLPAAYVWLDALPLNVNGKVDVQALPAPDLAALHAPDYEAPRGETEELMASLWASLLRTERVGRNDNFFELGGHSLMVVSLVGLLRERGFSIAVRDVFVERTLKALAARVSPLAIVDDDEPAESRITAGCARITPDLLPLAGLDQEEIDAVVATVPGGIANIQDIYGLSPLQDGILFHHLLQESGDAYLSRRVLSFESGERLDAFLGALRKVIARHDSLRTSFQWQGLSKPVQIVHRHVQLPIEERHLTAPVLPSLLEATDPRQRRLDVTRAPLMAAVIARETDGGGCHLALFNHHLITDHLSTELLIAEIDAFLAEREAELPPPLPYRNFIAQARRMSAEQHEQYFRAELGDVDEPTVPFGVLDTMAGGEASAETRRTLPPDLARRIHEAARRERLSPAALFHAAWALVVGRLSGRDDVVFGSVFSGRQGIRGGERAVGMFMNTLPFRMRLDARGVQQVVRDTAAQLAVLLDHEQTPLALAQRASGVRPPLPLFTALLNYRHSSTRSERALESASDGIALLEARERTNYPLTMSVGDLGGDFVLTALAGPGLDGELVSRCLESVVGAMVASLEREPERPFARLSILTDADRRRLVYDLNATESDPPADVLIQELFEQHAAARPDALAVACEEQRLTYGELNARANQLAHHLIQLGIGPDDRVAIAVERGPELVVGLLAILKAGGAFLPLDPADPPERLRAILEDGAPKALVSQLRLRQALPMVTVPALLLDDDELANRLSTHPSSNPDARAQGLASEHLAYVIYTSGSTGLPKGVAVPHRAANHYLAFASRQYLPASTGTVVSSPLTFDATLTTLLVPFAAGKPCFLLPDDRHQVLAHLMSEFQRREPLLFKLTPAHLEALASLAERPVSGVRHTVVVGGEQFSRHVLRRFLDRVLPDAVVVNEYGPTETVVGCTIHVCTADDRDASGAAVPIGNPIAGTKIYILDANREPVPAGVAGEIYIGGAGVARGYLNRPELTAERFLDDPFRPHAQARMYRTGDLARWLPDGGIEYLGRNDFQVKIRGFRIELGEIEAKLSACTGVREAVVIAREDVPGEKQLVAYVVGDGGVDLKASELRAQLSPQLPEAMVPPAFVILEALPLTANGKIDRKALPAPEATARSAREYEAPRDHVEATLAALWQALLGIDRVGRLDDFFELGGHSLLAVQLISRLRAVLGVEMPLRQVFARPALFAMAEAVREAGATTMEPILPADRDRPLELSLAQQRLWFLDQLDKAASAAYHMTTALRLTGNLDVGALQWTLDRLVARHESLRTSFREIDGVPYQQIAPPDRGFALSRQDLSALSGAERERTVAALAAEEARAPFDLSAGPLIRGRLLRLAADEHVLLLTQHHIVSDGWSLGVVTRELATLYTAARRGESDPLPPLEIQYADYAQWQRRWLQGEELARQLDFWKAQLSDAPALLNLPLDKPRPAVQSHAGGRVPFMLPAALTADLRALSQRQGVTLFMTLLSAWGVLLSRLSGQADVVIGTSVANRQRREIENLIGFFVNTLALRLRFDDRPTVAATLAKVKESTLAAFAHQELPFEQVVEAVQPVRSLSHSPLVQSMFAFNNTRAASEGVVELPGLTLAPVKSGDDSAHFDLSLSMADRDGILAGAVEFASDLFDRHTIERWTRYFVRILEAMAADDSAAVDTLPLLPEAERETLLVELSRAPAADVNGELIHELFEQQAALRPDAIAAVFEERALTYSELNARSNQLAHELIDLGVGPDDRVAIAVERGLDLVVGLLGILKAGAAYLPLDPAYPRERLQFMLQDGAPRALLTHEALALAWDEQALPIVCLDGQQWNERLSTRPADNPTVRKRGLTADHLAYLIYTSGSTGTPKGVMVEHHSLSSMAEAHAERFGVTEMSRVLQFVSPAFDVCAAEVFMALARGATLVAAPRERLMPGEPLQNTIRELGITHALLPAGVAMHLEPENLPSLHCLIVGGDVCPPSLVQRWHDRLDLFNAYGPTETSVCAAVQACDRPYPHGVPIGRPFANARIYVLDTNRELVPMGVEGEIYIGGVGVARGYHQRPELTAERFLRDPFSADPNARMYKTGDLGRWLPDGTLTYTGRNDFQVKIRGFRIELGEIEARLGAHNGVREAVVVVREDAPGDKRLVAYVVPEANVDLQASELREALAAQLPDFMIPAAFVTLDALPLTANRKLDRNAMPAPDAAAFGVREYEAPLGAIESRLAALWQDLLHVERVGRQDDFFELGGHSLLATQLISRLRATFGVELPLRAVFAEPRLSRLADAVRAASRSTMSAIPQADRNRPLPLSLAQQRLWFLDRLDKAASAAYHMPAALRLTGVLDVAALQFTLDRIVARHESLRTCFVAHDGVPCQKIASPDAGFALRHQDLSSLPAAEREALVTSIAAEEAAEPFDLGTGPLIRGRLLKLGVDEHVLLMTQHHIVSDGWSVNILIREVAALYTAFRNGQPDPLPSLEIQYADYAQWQRSWLEGEELARQGDYWKRHLSGAPALLSLPLDRPRPAVQSHAGGRVTFALPASLTAELRALSQRNGVTLFMTLLSAWGLLLSRLSGQTDVVIGTPVANRQRREVENLVGFFVNTLALRLHLDDNPTVHELLARAKETTLAAFDHQDLPFEQVVEVVQPQRSLSHSPIFQNLFAFNNTSAPGESAIELPELTLAPVRSTGDRAHFDLSLSMAERDGRLAAALEYASDLFDHPTVERWSRHFLQLLHTMTADETAAAVMLPLLPDAELRQVLHEFNASQSAESSEKLLHEQFETQAALQPDALAVLFEGRSLTYSELNARANQLAHHLIDLGVQPDERVAICMERSLDLVVALLGVLKAGGAYVPLDPAYPAERLQFMLDDAAPKAVLTHDVMASAVLSLRPAHNPPTRVRADHLAYVIYTSGSTGLPKGVMVEHGGLRNLADAQGLLFGVDARSRVLQFSSASFDASVWEMAMTLPRGGCLCLAPRDALMPGEPLVSTMRDLAITHATLPSTALSACGDVEFPALQCLVVAGDVFPPALVRRWQGRQRLFNAYGPTESSVCASVHSCEGVVRDTVPIGRPIANLRVYILDARRQPVPIGVEGEIYIGGAGVARGYLNRPELTEERFVSDPFSPDTGARMYRTGDLGRWLPDGTIEYLGRNDFQVKIRGFRIELGEIEARLETCAGVREAAVVAHEPAPGDKRLVAYVTAGEGVTLQAADLRAALSAQLPDYMVPAAFMQLDALPMNANGKVDRKQLPAPDAAAAISREYEPPEGEIESILAALWQQLLHVERVGRRDHFFELGGHSLLVVTLIERLRAVGLEGEVRAIFTAPVLCDYAATLSARSTAAAADVPVNRLTPETTAITPELLPLVSLTQPEIDRIVEAVPDGAGNIQDIYPLLPLQEGMLFHHLLESEGDVYLSRNLIAFDSRERLDIFLSVMERLIARHDILRTAIHWEGLSTPVQVVCRRASLPVEFLDLSAAEDVRDALLARTDPRRMRLDPRRAPLLAAYGGEDAARGEWLLSLLTHHMVCDHATLELAMVEVHALLDGREQQLTAALPLRNLVAQTARVPASEHEAYFREQLADIDEPTAPFDVFDVQVSSAAIETVRMRLDVDLSRRLRDNAGRLGVPASVLFHVAWAQVLARCTGRVDVVFGTVLSGRLQGAAGADRAMGLFINTLPLRVTVEGDARQIVAQTYQRMVTLLAHEQVPLSMAQRCSSVPTPLPLFTTLLNYRHSVDAADTAAPDLDGMRMLSVHETVNYPIAVSIDDYGRDFALKLQGIPAIDLHRVAGYLSNALTAILSAVETDDHTPLSAMDILSPADHEQLRAFNDTKTDYPADRLIHELFAQQTAAQPDAVAVVCDGESLTYAALDARANQLAHYLIELGVKPDDRVAICSERSVDLIVGLLGILKAGGAYVPLDPAYPSERLAWMLADCAPVALLTQSGVESELPETELPVIRLDLDMPVLARRLPAHAPVIDGLHARNLAYVIYTSGSTGTPKGVMVDHRCVNRLVINNPYFEAGGGDCIAHCANPAFDAATWEIWGALLNGARVLVVPPQVVMEPARLNTALCEGGVTALWLTVGLFNQYVDQLPNAFRQLRYLLVGGDALDPRTIRHLLNSANRPEHVVNGYGPTETTTFAITHDIRDVPADARSIPLGRPIANTRIYIVDRRGEPVPVGVAGEICIGGDGVARGYLNRPALTAERFVLDPFADDPDARMYKTGDRGRWLADGTIEFLGRTDFQVKIRGFRVELGEIETRLAYCAGVREAVVLAREDVPGEKQLVAYLVAEEGMELSVIDLRESLSRQLPDYMVPATFVQLDALPLTANGKLDRRALPAPESSALPAGDYEPPEGELEEIVAAVWLEQLKVPRVGRHDNFFELGGHSLIALRVMAALNARLDLQVSIRDVFECATVASLAASLERNRQLRTLRSDLVLTDSLDQTRGELVEL